MQECNKYHCTTPSIWITLRNGLISSLIWYWLLTQWADRLTSIVLDRATRVWWRHVECVRGRTELVGRRHLYQEIHHLFAAATKYMYDRNDVTSDSWYVAAKNVPWDGTGRKSSTYITSNNILVHHTNCAWWYYNDVKLSLLWGPKRDMYPHIVLAVVLAVVSLSVCPIIATIIATTSC